MADEIRLFELNTGAKIPSVGLGTWRAEPGVVAEAIAAAIKVGYRHIDCAPAYSNEKEIGHALKKLFGDGVVKREDLWITSKLWFLLFLWTESTYCGVPITCQKMYQRHWIELFRICRWIIWIFTFSMFNQIHWPVSMNKGSADDKPENLTQPDIASTWGAMEALFNSGKVRAIGVSNFSSRKLQDLLEVARVPLAVNQVECHPSWNQLKLHAFCKSKGVHLSTNLRYECSRSGIFTTG